MKVLIIEDERHAVSRLKTLIGETMPEAEVDGGLDSVSVALSWLKHNPAPDLIFCDIQLADGLSFEIFEKVEVKSPIIFTTAYDQYAIRAFKLNSLDYLLKPIDPKEFKAAVEKFRQMKSVPQLDMSLLKSLLHQETKEFKTRFLVKFGEKIQSIPALEVSFFFSEERVTFLQHQSGRKYVLDYALDQLEGILDPKQFFRLNRKYIAAIESIAEIHTYSNSRLKIRLKDCADNDILVSREKVGALKEWLDG
ncbi:Two-component system response regulator [Indibacter alkaliphilus LW1]|jgi:DNA-binding LytR/AlgR family response regulator|uniref:Two-component system response regulator n=1 Tax=Indibacter alkaliphilus (strain CCUG 57479 / KCTC 22604 / LW1) TaxID=1189612 RepID=S2CZW1_INDAL|nr:LytTR family DNA-binding domain-containing protein [Indibacter alkaliphilus]EOZ92144.1 Two-component system response regulator [Indibacter alkaliphilus LW1]